jgi:hypothetical protein
MNELSSHRIIGNYHQCLSWIKLLTEFDNALKIVVEDLLGVHIKLTLAETFLVSFNHHENYFLILIRAFEEVL